MKWNKKTKRAGLLLIILALVVTGGAYYFIWNRNINLASDSGKEYLFIPTGSTFDNVVSILKQKKLLRDENSFIILSKSIGYHNAVLPGKYRLKKNMSNFDLVKLLRSGKQEPVKLVIKGSQSMENFFDYIGNNMEITGDLVFQKLSDEKFLSTMDLKKETAPCLIIPNTYEVYWNTSPEKFLDKMHAAYDKFWTDKRLMQCRDAGLTRAEVVTMASIIEKETDKDGDLPVIAGVYINRMAKGMKLQADPTVLFAMGDHTSKRVYSGMLDYDSPYNTYKVAGLPPGPICIPAIQSVDAVLNYQKHDFLYFCARADGSGYSDFTASYEEHKLNAKKYRHYLDTHNIK
jgi:UPF0755 protein